MIDDRKMYKPGEEVSLKGWLRTIDYGKNGDVGGSAARSSASTYKVDRLAAATRSRKGTTHGQRGRRLRHEVHAAEDAEPRLRERPVRDAGPTRRAAYTHGFQIEEFRRPEFEVSAQASQGPFLVGGSGDVTVDAKYYAGGPLPGAPVNWYVTASADRRSRRRTATTTCSAAGSRGGAITAWYDDEARARRAARRRQLDARRARPTRPASTCCTWTSCRVEAGDADVGHRERERHRRQPPDVVRVGGADRPSVVAATSASRRRSRSSRRARRSTST